ncbi:DUF2267 domain-containing protein [Streptomyces sp. 15-116A]|uniref:DUF2267 domain-containing protein n=1 Tax=Streptomyces sp. 15-116A TaxID=2259035 RepID=UPI0021B2D3D1|nr:DUF2267 domain-containing protein [Streptomyces sp. 15-116A]MCT7354716.1 DUF2267 domain-containing protein [Streptomyces sp. 15-116A]
MNSAPETLDTFLDRVADGGGYTCPQQAARATQHVLEVLGAHLVGDDRTDLARLLPRHCGPLLSATEPATEPLPPESFVAAVAERGDDSVAEARRAVTAVLPVLAELADDALLRRILTQLPPGHAGLFGRTEPA